MERPVNGNRDPEQPNDQQVPSPHREDEPVPEPPTEADFSFQHGPWVAAGTVPAPPTFVSIVELEELRLQDARTPKKVYIVYPGPYPGVYLSWTSTASATVGIKGAHQCRVREGLNHAYEQARRQLQKPPPVYW